MKEFRSPVTGQRVTQRKREAAWEARRHPTLAEAVLWQALRGSRLRGLHFRREQVIDGYIVDFYCHAARLVVEVDGSIHSQQRAYDEARDRALTARSLRVLRVTNDEVLHALPSVLATITDAAGLSAPSTAASDDKGSVNNSKVHQASPSL